MPSAICRVSWQPPMLSNFGLCINTSGRLFSTLFAGAGDACVAPTLLREMDACRDIFTHTGDGQCVYEHFPASLFGMPGALCCCRGTPLWLPGFDRQTLHRQRRSGRRMRRPDALAGDGRLPGYFTHTPSKRLVELGSTEDSRQRTEDGRQSRTPRRGCLLPAAGAAVGGRRDRFSYFLVAFWAGSGLYDRSASVVWRVRFEWLCPEQRSRDACFGPENTFSQETSCAPVRW